LNTSKLIDGYRIIGLLALNQHLFFEIIGKFLIKVFLVNCEFTIMQLASPIVNSYSLSKKNL